MRSTFPVANQSYSKIVLPNRAFRNEADRARITALLAELSMHDGGPFPVEIDNASRKIAAARRGEEPFRYWLLNPTKRVAHQWLTPFAGFGWPTVTEDASEIRRIRTLVWQGPVGIVEAIWTYPAVALAKGLVAGCRYALLVLAFIVDFLLFRLGTLKVRLVVFLGLSYAVAPTLALSFFNESRYLIGAVPGLEMAVGAGLFSLWQQRELTELLRTSLRR